MKQSKLRMLFIIFLTAWAAYSVAPSVIYFSSPKETRNDAEEMAKKIPDWLPGSHVKLGLDLQGGVQLVLGVNTDTAVDNKLARIGTEVKRWSDDNNHKVSKAFELSGQQKLRIDLEDGADVGDFREKFKDEFPGLVKVGGEGQTLEVAYDDEQISRIKLSAIEQAERVIRNRVDKWGVAEPVINRRKQDNSVLVQLPGFRDPSKAKELLGRTAQLRFKLVDDEFKGFDSLTDKVPEGITATTNGGQTAFSGEDRDALTAFLSQVELPADRELYFSMEEVAGGKKNTFLSYVVEAQTGVGGDDVLDAYVSEDQSGLERQPVVALRFTGPGGKRFGDITGENVGRRLAIILDDVVESAPNIQTKIANGQATITMGTAGGFQKVYEEANQLALILKSGALPATIEVLEERQVGATLGPELADQGVKGAMVGLMLVLFFMLVYYRKPGFVACLALVLNGLFLLALMANFQFALTLPGIAGFILTLGMAVDANVLINERIRFELREGKNARKAVEVGFQKVFWTIIDANVTTLIAALVLLETNSSGPIRGFAVTLILGLIVSLFTSLYCSKFFFEFVVSKLASDQAVRSWLGGKAAEKQFDLNFNFLRHGKMAAIIGAVLTLAVIGSGGVRGINWGVDFAGGAEMMVSFDKDTDTKEIQALGKTVGIPTMTLQALEGDKPTYLIRFGGEEQDSNKEAKIVQAFKSSLETNMAANGPEILQIDYVGPQIGKELRTQGVLSVLFAMIGVIVYILFRFDMRFAPGAIFKMFLDIFVIFGFYIFFWRSFDLTSVAAFLTVVGYSVNDTIVIYDRIRENVVLHGKRSLFDNINIALNECLSRTINTSVTTVIALMGILVFGSGQIFTFALAMTIGVIAATLSSQFLASSFILWSEAWRKTRAAAAKSGGSNRPATARS